MRSAGLAAGVLGGFIAMFFGAGATHALDLKDRLWEFGTTYTAEAKDFVFPVNSSPPRTDDGETPRWIFAVGGKLLSEGHNLGSCHVSFVYTPGRPFAGKLDCKPERFGTASNWVETAGSATFRTTATVAGDVVTLKGEMTGTKKWDRNRCNTSQTTETIKFTVSESLKIRIRGEGCQVLEYSHVVQEERVGDERGSGVVDGQQAIHRIERTILRLGPSRSCKIEPRGDKGPLTRSPPSVFSC